MMNLKNMKLNLKVLVSEKWNGENYKFVFPNGYGASVIKHIGSYGWREDLFELAVLHKATKTQYNLCYSTEITNDVLGFLTNEDVLELLERIKNLESEDENE